MFHHSGADCEIRMWLTRVENFALKVQVVISFRDCDPFLSFRLYRIVVLQGGTELAFARNQLSVQLLRFCLIVRVVSLLFQLNDLVEKSTSLSIRTLEGFLLENLWVDVIRKRRLILGRLRNGTLNQREVF